MNNGVQAFRALLFVGVLSFHCGIPIAKMGWSGVETFLVISAYYLTIRLLKNHRESVFIQIKRRYKRLVFAYIPVLFLGVLYAAWKRQIPYDLPFHIFFLQDFLWMYTHYSSPMISMTAHTWTLSFDFCFGALWVFVVAQMPDHYMVKGLKAFSFAMMALAFIWREFGVVTELPPIFISVCPLAHADAFAIGTMAAILHEKSTKNQIGWWIVGCVGLCGILYTVKILADTVGSNYLEAYFQMRSANVLKNVVTCNLYLYLSLFTGAIFKWLIDNPLPLRSKNPLVLLGNDSYEMYLFHWPIHVVVHHFIKNCYHEIILVFIVTVVCVQIFKWSEKFLLNKGFALS